MHEATYLTKRHCWLYALLDLLMYISCFDGVPVFLYDEIQTGCDMHSIKLEVARGHDILILHSHDQGFSDIKHRQ